jgi:hypothetical protein
LINLDALDRDELRSAALVLRSLIQYTNYKHMAIGHRADGWILAAQGCERECEKLYAELPDWAKW